MRCIKIKLLISGCLFLTVVALGQSDGYENTDSISSKNKLGDLESFFDEFNSSTKDFNKRDSIYYEYERFNLNHRKSVFKWQFFSSIIIFFVVILIVLSGLILSYLHFKRSLITNENSETEFEISKVGIKVRSSIIGIVILVISIVFFYLYLTHIYKIEEIQPVQINKEQLSD